MGLEPSFKFVSMNKCTKINPAETSDQNHGDEEQNTENYNKINQNTTLKVSSYSTEQQHHVSPDIQSSMTVPTMLSKMFVVNKVPPIQIIDKQNIDNNRTNLPEMKISEANTNDSIVTMETHATLVQLTDAVLSQSKSTKSTNNTTNVLIPTRSMNDEDNSKINASTTMANTNISDNNDSYINTFVSKLYSIAETNIKMIYNIP